MTGVKPAGFLYVRRAVSLPSGIMCSKPLHWALCDLSRTTCSSCATWFSLTTLSQWISTLNCENGPTDCFPPLAAIAEDELVQPLSLLGICTVVHYAWQDPMQRCWADRRGLLLLAFPGSFEKLYSWVIKSRMHWGLIYKVVSIS